METGRVWVIHDDEERRQECAAALARLGVEAVPLAWDQLESRLARQLQPRDWVLVDHRELEAAPLELHRRFRELVWRSRVAVVADRELPARLMQSGWVLLERPLDCRQVERRLAPLLRG